MSTEKPTSQNEDSKILSHSQRNLLIEQLEERVLFDAVPVAPLDTQTLEVDMLAQMETITNAISSDAISDQQQENQSASEIVFVDKSVEGFEEVVAEFVAGRDVEVFFINDGSAGLEQIANHLEGRSNLDAIHIISHGTDAQLNLGNSVISNSQLGSQYSSELVRIGTALSESGDILIYGCDLAASADGEAFIRELSELTNADVAASDDLTGAADQGGDWELEKRIGLVEAQTMTSQNFKGTLLETDAGFVVGTASFGAMNEVAVTPLSEGGVSSRLYANAATANSGSITIDLRLTLIDTFDEFGNVTTGTVDQMPITFSDFAGGPILLSRYVGSSAAGYMGHTAHVMVEFFDNANGNPLSVVGDFTFKDIDYIGPASPDNGKGSEAVTIVSDQIQSYQMSSTPATSIVTEDNGDGTTTFTNYTTSGGENDEERWVSVKFHDMTQLNLRFDSRDRNTGYGLSTANFSATPISYSQPEANDDDFTTDQNTTISGNVVTADNGNGVDSDPDNDPLDVYLINGDPALVGNPVAGSNGGSFVINADGTYIFNPGSDFDYLAPGESLQTDIQYTIRDYTGLASTATVTVTVNGTNDDPTSVGTIPNQSNLDADTISPLDITGYFTDIDTSQSLTYSAGGTLPLGLSINPTTGILSGTIDNSASLTGPFTVVITANDGSGGTTTQSFVWTVANPGPTATNNQGSVNENGPPTKSGNVIADNDGNGVDSDPDNDTLTVSAVAGGSVGSSMPTSYGSIVINADGTYTYTLDNSNPTVNALDNGDTLIEVFTYTVSDGEGGTDSATLTITVNGSNDAPVVGATIPSQSDSDADTISTLDVSSYFSDAEGDTLTYSAANLPAGLSINPTNGQITGTIDNSASQGGTGGVYTVSVTATDTNGGNVTTNFSWTVSNPGPTAVNDANSTTQLASASGNVLSNDSDPDGDTITVNQVDGSPANVGSAVAGSSGGQFTINTNGSYNFDPGNDFDSLAVGETATTSITYQITDSEGGTDTAVLTITVAGTNDNPVTVGTIPTQSNVDGESISTLDVSGYFDDVDTSDTFTFGATGLPSGLTLDSSTGEITGTTDNSSSLGGPYSVTITADDGNGGIIAQSFTWNVTNPAPTATDNTATVTEDTILTDSGNIISDNDGSGVDNDPDGDALNVSAVNGAGANVSSSVSGSFGSVVINGDGSYTYTLDNNNPTVSSLDNGETLTDSFSYTITDGEGGTSTASLTVTISGNNDAPVVGGTIPSQADVDGLAITALDVSAYFSDPDGDSLTYSAANLPTGLSIDPGTGLITGTLDNSASQSVPGGVYSITVTATDDNSENVSTTFTWTVTNPGPDAVDDNGATDQNTLVSGDVIANDSDPDNDTITVNAVNGSAPLVGNPVTGSNGGTFTINSDGSGSFDPGGDFHHLSAGDTLSTSISYTITDGEGGTDTATVTIIVTGVNDDPLPIGTIPNQVSVDAETISTLNVSPFFGDGDVNDTLTFTATGLPTGLSIDAGGNVTGTVDNSASLVGTHSVTVTADDGRGGTVDQTFTWTVGNPGPIAVNDADFTDQDTSTSGNVMSNDSDPDGDTITVVTVNGAALNVGSSIAGDNGGLFTINANGSFNFLPNADFDFLAVGETASTQVTYEISDGEGGTATAILDVTVTGTNDNPTIVGSIPDQASLDAETISTLDVSGYFDDVDSSDMFTFTASGLPTGLSIDPSTGEITGTIDNSASLSGSYTVTISVDDGHSVVIAQSFTWTVSNPAPIATDNTGAVTEDGVLTDSGNVITDNDGSGVDTDPDGDALLVSAVNGSGANVGISTLGSYGAVVINSNGIYTYTLDNNNMTVNALDNGETLTEAFNYSVSDGEGGTSTAQVTITINGTNDDPEVVGTIPDQSNDDNETIATVDVSSYFSDPDGDPLTFSAVGLPAGLGIAANGEITGTIDNSASQGAPGGVYTVTITATDDNGDSVSDMFTWTVANLAPTAQDNAGSVTEDTLLTDSGNVILDNDGSGLDNDPDGDVLTVDAVDGNVADVGVTVAGSYGSIVINSNGSYTYTLDNTNPTVSALDISETLTDSFTYTVTDGEGGSSTATLSVTINGSNDAPVVGGTIPDQFGIDSQAIITVDVSSFFSDVDDPLTYSASGLPSGLSIDPLSGEITGTPGSSASQGGTSGVYTCSITATDDNGQSATTTFNWTITNPAPVASGDSFTTNEDTSVSNTVAGNDSDADDAVSFNQTSVPANGSLILNPDGSFTYTPDADFHGVDSFDYEIVDADGDTATATVTITVDPVNDPPVVDTAIPDQSNFDAELISLDVAPNFSDVDGDGLTFTATGLPTGLSIDASGNITGTIDSSASASGPFIVVVTANDSNGGTITDTFNWTVTNPAPTAVNDSFIATEDITFSGSVAPNDSDIDGDTLLFNQTTLPANGTVVFNSDGSFDYTPDANFVGTDTFDYEVIDFDGATTTATATILVNPVNDPPVVDTTIPDQNNVDSQAINFDVSGNFSDTEGDGLTFSATGLPTGLTIDAAGNITGTIGSSASSSGPFTVVITADDGNGGTVTDTFTWTVTNPAPMAVDDNFATNEDTPVVDTVASNDADSDGDLLTFVKTANPTNGSVVFNNDGTFTYTPDADFHGTDSFTYDVTDADGSISTATVTITITSVNDAPVVDTIIPDQANLDSETISMDVSGNFSDPEGDTLTFTATGLPSGLSIDAAGNITGMISSSASAGGPYIVVITANDSNGGTITDTFTWTITNPAPVASGDSFTTNEDTSVSATVAGNDSDADDAVSFNQTSVPANGSVILNPDGSFTYTPDADFHGIDSFDYEIVDADGDTATATVTITVDPVNDPPVVGTPIPDQSNFDAELISLDVAPNFSDVDGDGLTFTATGLPTGLSIDASGNITGTIDSSASASGPFIVVVTANDSNGGTITDTFTWAVTNPAPTATDNSTSVNEDTGVTGAGNVITADSGSGIDADPDSDSLAVSAIDGNASNVGVMISGSFGSIQINADGTYVYTLDNSNPTVDALDIGETLTETFGYTISDGEGGTSSASLTITINGQNDTPIVGSTLVDQLNMDADSAISVDTSTAFSDVDGDVLTYTIIGLPAGLVFDPTSGIISGTIDGNASISGPSSDGVYSVEVTATDDNGQSVSTTFNWTVDNPVPVAVDDAFSTMEDVPLISSVATNDSDPDNDLVSYSVASGPTDGSLILNADGSFTYSPNADFFGTDSFDYELCDVDGDCTTATVTINISSVNDDPSVNSAIPDQSDFDNDTINLDVSANFGDPEGDALTYTATGLPPGLTIDAVGNITGTIDSDASQSGPYTAVITVVDTFGATVTDTFTWTVTNPAPNATNDSFSTDEDVTLSGDVSLNDADPDGDAVTFNLTSGTTNGLITFNSDGSFIYTPNLGYNGYDSFDYEIVDADGDTAIASAVISIGAVNDVPTIDSAIPDQNAFDSEFISLDISGSFSDPEGDSLTYTATGLPLGLSLDALTGVIAGTIDSSASVGGPYTVIVTVNDGNGGSISDTFGWTVTNPAPIALDDNYTTLEDTPLSSTVVGNDFDSDGDGISFSLVSGPTNGSVVFNSDGSFTYAADPDYFGSDSFTYQVTDVDGDTSTAVATINIAPVNDGPAAVDDNETTPEDTPVTIDVLGNDSDPENDPLTVSIINGPTHGIVSVNPDGSIQYVPDPDFHGVDTFEYEICDTSGACTTAIVSINVAPVNDSPVANDDGFTTTEDTPVLGTLVTNDSDPDGDPLTYTLVSPPTSGALSLNTDGTFVYTPAPNFNGPVTFQYEATDPAGQSDIAIVTINVTPVNDAPTAPNDADSTNENDKVTINLLGNDFDPESDPLSIAEINGVALNPGGSITLVSGAIVTVNSDGTADYDPNSAFDGLSDGVSAIDTFQYTVTDGNGGFATAQAVVTINGENDPPVAEDDYVKISVDTTVTVTVIDNDYDVDGDPLAVVLLNSPVGGTANVNPDGTITFVPDSGFEGTVHIHYLVEDPSGSTNDATLTIEVEADFRFDSFNNFSQTQYSLDRVDHAELAYKRTLSQQIYSLAPEPIFSGFARPGTQIVGRIYDASGSLIGESTATTDTGGNWLIQFQGTSSFEFYRIEFDQVATPGGADIYGYLGLNPADNSYQAMEALTVYDKPMSVEGAMINSLDTLLQSQQQNYNPLGVGR